MFAALRAHFDARQARAHAFMQQLEEESHHKTKDKRKKERTDADKCADVQKSAGKSAGKSAHVQSTDVPAGVWQEAAAVTTDVSGGGSEGLGAVGGAVRGERGEGRESKITPCLVHILKSQFTSSF